MPIYLSRHGQTHWNLAGLLQGHSNSHLTALGVTQAHELAASAARHQITKVVSSDLGRAVHTAEIVAKKLNCHVTTDTSLRERYLGAIEGVSRAQSPELWYAFDHRFSQDTLSIPQAESTTAVANRIVDALMRLQRHQPSENILVVGHGEWLRILLNVQTGVAPWSNCHQVPDNGVLIPYLPHQLQCAG